MITRIGKYSFIINLVLSIVLLSAWVIGDARAPFALLKKGTTLILQTPLLIHILSCMLAIPLALINRKKPLTNNLTSSTFNLFFYINSVVTIVLALGALALTDIFADKHAYIPLMSIAALTTVITNIIISTLTANAIAAWKNSRFTTIVMGCMSMLLLLSFVGLTLFTLESTEYNPDFIAENEPRQEYETYSGGIDYEYNEADDYDGEDEGYEEGDDIEHDYDGEFGDTFESLTNDIKPAVKYFYSKMNLKQKNISSWSILTGWNPDNSWNSYDNDKNGEDDNLNNSYDENMKWNSQEKFNEAKQSFHKIYSRYKDQKPGIKRLYALYSGTVLQNITPQTYKKAGFNNLVELLLQARNDIYSNDDYSDTLKWIYKAMTNPSETLPPADSTGRSVGSWGTSDYYPHFKKFMSTDTDNIVSKIQEDNAEREIATVWAYSFWARRHNEKTDDIVYDILIGIRNYYK